MSTSPKRTPPRLARVTTLLSAPLATSPLTDEMLERFRERAPIYDRENRFFEEDFEELRASGYLNIAVPEDLGGRGFTLAQVAEQQHRLAYYAPATALAVNMHIYWTGRAADLRRMDDFVAGVDSARIRGRRDLRRWSRRVGQRPAGAALDVAGSQG